MSGFTYEKGSVISFFPGEGEDKNVSGSKVIGYAIVVTGRSMWVLETELVPVWLLNGEVVVGTPRADRGKRT